PPERWEVLRHPCRRWGAESRSTGCRRVRVSVRLYSPCSGRDQQQSTISRLSPSEEQDENMTQSQDRNLESKGSRSKREIEQGSRRPRFALIPTRFRPTPGRPRWSS